LPGEETRHKPQGPANVELSLPLDVAETVHAALEDLLQDGREDTELARGASSVEEYEAARDRTLGPILDGLESAENRDP
jgi:ABC-type phosphate/phosphonate transport system substrate-binding protein